SEYTRRAAVEVLNAIGNTNAIKDLLGALRDKDWWVRVRAADALGSIGGPRVVEAVLPLIKDEDEFIRRCAVEVLNTTKDERAFTYLVEALEDKDWWVQERAVDALVNLRDQRAVPALLRLLAQDTAATPAVVRALVTFGDPQALAPLLAKLQSSQRAVKKEVLRAMATLTDAEHAESVQRAMAQIVSGTDKELKELAASVLHALTARFEDQTGMVASPSTRSTAFQSQSLLGGAATQYLPESRSGSALHTGTTTADMVTEVSLAPVVIDASELEPDTVLADRYRVIRRAGKGGFGIVLLVEDMVVHEEIILKFLNPLLAADDNIIKRFIRELRYARKITHENVIRIYDFITLGRSFAISMEYFPSHALAALIKPKVPLEQRRGLKIIRDVCCGVSVAHHANIVHRDLKPQNILINDDGLVKIVDFGLAAAVSHADSRLTGSGVLMGTPTYMAPEQVRGGTIDLRTDIYSLGVIMYELFTSRPPYLGEDPLSILYQHVEGQAMPPRTLNEHIPPALEEIILKAMAVDPDHRYQSVGALRESLDALASQEAG
ncbi:MAG TPA: protein kinase, partial [Candidatus Tectomicrobia bacterium]